MIVRLCTIGDAGCRLDDVLGCLHAASVQVVIDVRECLSSKVSPAPARTPTRPPMQVYCCGRPGGGAGRCRTFEPRHSPLPLSRKPGFSKRQLAAALDAAGIDYVHIRALGTPKSGRDAARAGRVAQMRHIFASHLETEAARTGLADAAAIARRRTSCLLCFEADHRACHRDMVAALIGQHNVQPIANLVAAAAPAGWGCGPVPDPH